MPAVMCSNRGYRARLGQCWLCNQVLQTCCKVANTHSWASTGQQEQLIGLGGCILGQNKDVVREGQQGVEIAAHPLSIS